MSGKNRGVAMGFIIQENRQIPEGQMVVDHDNMTLSVSNIYAVALGVLCTPDNFEEQVDWCFNHARNHVINYINNQKPYGV